MANTPNPQHYVSTFTKRLRKRLIQPDATNEERTKALKEIVDLGINDFATRLKRGDVRIETVSDFERLAKLGLLLMDKPTERVEHTETEMETVEETFTQLTDTDNFQAVKELLAKQMNARNEEGHR